MVECLGSERASDNCEELGCGLDDLDGFEFAEVCILGFNFHYIFLIIIINTLFIYFP